MSFSIVVICASEGGCKIEIINGFLNKEIAEEQAKIIRSMESPPKSLLVRTRVIVSPVTRDKYESIYPATV